MARSHPPAPSSQSTLSAHAAAVDGTRRRLAGGLAGLIAAPAGLAVPTAHAQSAGGTPPLPPVGTPFGLAALPLLGGGRFEPAEAQGRVTLLYWWASWCPFCAIQSPLVEQLWRAQRERGLVVLGLSVDATAEAAQAYRVKRGFGFPSAWVGPTGARALAKPGGGLPVTLVRGRDGRLLMSESGQLFPEDIEQIARFL